MSIDGEGKGMFQVMGQWGGESRSMGWGETGWSLGLGKGLAWHGMVMGTVPRSFQKQQVRGGKGQAGR